MNRYGREQLRRIFEALELPKNTRFRGYVIMNGVDERYLIDLVPEGLLWSNRPDDAIVLKKHKKAIELKKLAEEDNVGIGLLFETDELILPLAEDAVRDVLFSVNQSSKR